MMIQALRALGASKLRTALTALAIALSVGLVSGTFVMGDTINSTFSQVFSDATSGTDTRVQAVGFDNDDDNPPRVSAALVDQIRHVDGVEAAEPVVSRWGVAILDRDGDPLGGNGPPRFGWSWNENPSINPFDLREGRAPRGSSEVAIDATSAAAAGYVIGEPVRVVAFAGEAKEYELVGIVGFGEEDNLALATVALFSSEYAPQVLDTGDTATFIDAVAEDGVSQQVLTDRISAILPDRAEAVTGTQAGEDLLGSVEGDIALFRNILLGFGSVALLVAAFTIFNTFAITVAQRTRHLALYRAVGASSAQVRRLVLVEAAILGLGASLIGLGLGVLLSIGLFELFGALGAALPSTDPVLAFRTIWVSLLIGVLATVVAALLPAWRASRVAPVAALRGAAAESPRISRLARIAGVALPAAGAALVVAGVFAGYGLAAILLGSLTLLVGAAVALQQLARPVVAVLGAPLRRMGLSGRLARENAMRNPRRAAVTAGALMIGLALVSVASVFTASAKTSINEIIDERFAGDYAIFSEDFPLDPEIAERLDADPAFSAVARWRITELIERAAPGQQRFTDVYGTDPAIMNQVYDPDVVDGDIVSLGDGGVALQSSAAEDRGLEVGDTLTGALGTPRGERSVALEVEAIYDDPTIGDVIVSLPFYERSFTAEDDFLLLKAASDDDLTAADAAVQAVGDDYPTVTAQDRTAFKEDAAAAADQLFTLILALLALAIIIAVLGIVNTLALSVVERTREIGLLRAVGMSRRQVAGMIRGESVLLAMLGGVVGIALGVGLASMLVPQVEDITVLEIPAVQLGVFLLACVIVGLVASLLPARRAAGMDVLRAISSD